MMIIKHKGHVDLKTLPVRRGHSDGENVEIDEKCSPGENKAVEEFWPSIHQISFHLSLLIATTWQQLDCGFVVIFTTRNDTLCTNNPSGDCRNKPRAKKKFVWASFQKDLFKSSPVSSINGSGDDCDEDRADYSPHNAIKSEGRIAEKLVNNFHLAINLSSQRKAFVGKIFSTSVYHALVIKINLSSHRGYDSLFSFRDFHANEIFPWKVTAAGGAFTSSP